MATSPEEETREADVEAFFALPRARLFGSALGLLALALGVAAIGQLAAPTLGLWTLPLYPAVVAALAAMLRRSAAGRGVLWTFSRRGMVGSLSPTRTVRLWVGLTVAAAVLAAVLEA